MDYADISNALSNRFGKSWIIFYLNEVPGLENPTRLKILRFGFGKKAQAEVAAAGLKLSVAENLHRRGAFSEGD